VQLPRESVCGYDDFRCDTESTVTPVTASSDPNPAPIGGFCNMFPETNLWWLGGGVIASLAAKDSAAASDLARPSIKGFQKNFTCLINLAWIGANQ